MEPGSENNENIIDGEGSSTGKIIKTEYGNNVEIKVEMAMATNSKSIEEPSVGVIEKKLILRKAIVKISPEDKLNAETVDEKDKCVYFKGVKCKPQNLPDLKNKINGKGSHSVKKRKIPQKGKPCLVNTSKNTWMFLT